MHTPHTPPRLRARAAAAAVAALLVTIGGLLVATPAMAHDELVAAYPVVESTVDALPAEISLTFSGEIAPDPGATELQVTDSAGTSLAEGDPVVQSNVVTQALSGEASGVVNVLWKVVSSDGHPISGEYTFTIVGASPPTTEPTDGSTEPSAPATDDGDAATTSPTTAPTAAPVSADAGNPALPWIIGGLILFVAVAGAVLYLLVSRARRQRTEQALRAGAGTTPRAPSDRGSEPPADR